MSDKLRTSALKRIRFAPVALLAGIFAAVLLSLSLTGTLSGFAASITNTANSAASGTLIMQEQNAGARTQLPHEARVRADDRVERREHVRGVGRTCPGHRQSFRVVGEGCPSHGGKYTSGQLGQALTILIIEAREPEPPAPPPTSRLPDRRGTPCPTSSAPPH